MSEINSDQIKNAREWMSEKSFLMPVIFLNNMIRGISFVSTHV